MIKRKNSNRINSITPLKGRGEMQVRQVKIGKNSMDLGIVS